MSHRYDLLYELVARDLKLRYKRSVLGIAWSLLNPLLQLLVFAFVFGTVLPLGIPDYVPFLFTGILAWTWFHGALLTATSSIVDNRDLVKRPGFPAAVLPAVAVTSHGIHFLLAMPILFGFLWLHGSPLTSALLALPAVIALQFVLTVSLAYLVGALHVTFRDTQYLVALALQLLMFLTPVFYDAGRIPALDRASYRMNPMVHLCDAYRAILLRGEYPDAFSLLMLGICVVGLLAAGRVVFARASERFVDEL
jgi:lipopolysaccharide transport system permease protein